MSLVVNYRVAPMTTTAPRLWSDDDVSTRTTRWTPSTFTDVWHASARDLLWLFTKNRERERKISIRLYSIRLLCRILLPRIEAFSMLRDEAESKVAGKHEDPRKEHSLFTFCFFSMSMSFSCLLNAFINSRRCFSNRRFSLVNCSIFFLSCSLASFDVCCILLSCCLYRSASSRARFNFVSVCVWSCNCFFVWRLLWSNSFRREFNSTSVVSSFDFVSVLIFLYLSNWSCNVLITRFKRVRSSSDSLTFKLTRSFSSSWDKDRNNGNCRFLSLDLRVWRIPYASVRVLLASREDELWENESWPLWKRKAIKIDRNRSSVAVLVPEPMSFAAPGKISSSSASMALVFVLSFVRFIFVSISATALSNVLRALSCSPVRSIDWSCRISSTMATSSPILGCSFLERELRLRLIRFVRHTWATVFDVELISFPDIVPTVDLSKKTDTSEISSLRILSLGK